MKKSAKRRAYLVSVSEKRQPVRVYAVLAGTPDEALEVVALSALPSADLMIVGGLSRDVAKRLHLKPDELRLV